MRPRTPRTKKARERLVNQRRADIAVRFARYCAEGNANGVVRRIARELGVDHSVISKELTALNIQWRETAADTIASIKAHLIRELERDILELREEWARSRTDTPTEDTIEGIPGADGKMQPDRMQRKKKSAAADVRYQSAITAKQAELAKLVGAYAPEKVANTDPEGTGPQRLIVEYVTRPMPPPVSQDG